MFKSGEGTLATLGAVPLLGGAVRLTRGSVTAARMLYRAQHKAKWWSRFRRAQRAFKSMREVFARQADELLTRRVLPQGKLLKVGRLSQKVREFIESKGLTPSTNDIVIPDSRLLRMRRDTKREAGIALPESVIQRLPELLYSPKAVLWERDRKGLLYVFDVPGDARKGKIVIKIEYNVGKRANEDIRPAVVSGSIIGENALLDRTAYEVVEGALRLGD